jgi:sugar phosphate isomerase/epimerase
MTQISRRRCLQQLALLVAGAPLARSLGAEAKPSPAIPLGFSLYGMRSLKPAEALRVCAEVGYDGVELALMAGWPTDPARLAGKDRLQLGKQLADSGLALLGLMENLPILGSAALHHKNLDRLKLAAELGHTLSPKAPPVIETILGGRPPQWDRVKEAMAGRLSDWAKVAEKARTVVAIKPHVGGAMHTPEGALWLHRQVASPWIQLAYDYSHFALRGFDLEKSLRAMLPHTRFIHVKDGKGTAEKFQFLLPGQGSTDYASYFSLLKKLGYQGPVVVEVSGQIHSKPGYDPIQAARVSYANLAPVLK